MTNKKKCALCKTTKSVKYKHNNWSISQPLDYCNSCILIVKRDEDPEWVGFSNFINNNN